MSITIQIRKKENKRGRKMNWNKCMKKKCKDCKLFSKCFKEDSESGCKQSKNMQKSFTNQMRGKTVEQHLLQH